MLIAILCFILALFTGDSNDGGVSSGAKTIFNFPIGGGKHIKDLIKKTAIQEMVTPQDLESQIFEYFVKSTKMLSRFFFKEREDTQLALECQNSIFLIDSSVRVFP